MKQLLPLTILVWILSLFIIFRLSDFFFKDAKEVVIKAQILAGGRGLGTFNNGFKGGVHLSKTYDSNCFLYSFSTLIA